MKALLLISLLILTNFTMAQPQHFESKTAKLSSITMHYVVGGKGPLMLLIHGWPECWYEWRKVMPMLEQNYTVIAVDLRGAGESTVTDSGYDKKTLAADVHELVKQLGYKTAILVGHDWGASVAYAYAAQFRSEVTKLIVCEGIPFGKWTPKLDLFWFFDFFRIKDHFAESSIRGNEKAFFTYFYQKSANVHIKTAISDADIDFYLKYLSQPERLSASFGFFRTIEQDSLDNNQWAQNPLTVPVLAIGTEYQAGGQIADVMRVVASNVQGVVMPNCGHFAPEEQPEAFVKLLNGFVN